MSKYIILSAFKADLPDDVNHEHHLEMLDTLQDDGTGHRELMGCHKGSIELCVIMNNDNIELAIALALRYSQDGIIILYDPEAYGVRHAFEYLLEGVTNEVGYFRSVPKERAIQGDNYTYDYDQNAYFITTKERVEIIA